MKKLVKSNKGFSLVELLIVIAILGIISAIAITTFSGVLTSQKSKADQEVAAQLKKAIQTYVAESNDVDLSELTTNGTTKLFTSTTTTPYSATIANLITALSNKQTIAATVTSGEYPGTYGPYLEASTRSQPQSTNFNFYIMYSKGSYNCYAIAAPASPVPVLPTSAGMTGTLVAGSIVVVN